MTNPNQTITKKLLVILVCAVLAFSLIYVVAAQSTVVSANASTTQPQVGSTLTVTIKISNVQNLFTIGAITLTWNPSVLSLTNSNLSLGVESHPDGVLHGTPTTDPNNFQSGYIGITETKISGSYNLQATSLGSSTSSFSGSGTVVTLTFNVLATGPANLALDSDLADKAASGQTASTINAQNTASSVTAIAAGSTPSASVSPSLTPSNSPTVPEFPSTFTAAIAIAIAIASALAIMIATKKDREKPSATA